MGARDDCSMVKALAEHTFGFGSPALRQALAGQYTPVTPRAGRWRGQRQVESEIATADKLVSLVSARPDSKRNK